jgi:hypothetical protein
MKTKLPSNKTQPKKVTMPMPNPAPSQAEGFPPGAEYISKLLTSTPREMTLAFCPNLQTAPPEVINQAIESLAGYFSSVPLFNFGVQVPEWVKAASRNCQEFFRMDLDKGKNGNLLELGKAVGMMEVKQLKGMPTDLKNAATDFAAFLRADTAKLPAKGAKQFFTGIESTEKIIGKNQIPQRKKVFCLISVAWREVEKFESAGQLHNWLVKIGTIDPITDPAETRKVCRLIGLKFRDKAGRPPKKK